MSVEATSWALNLAPVPADRGQPSSVCKFVLVGLANHARPDGVGVFPSVATLVRYTGLSERTRSRSISQAPVRHSAARPRTAGTTMLTGVHQRPTTVRELRKHIRLNTGERLRTGMKGMNETKTEPRPGPGAQFAAAESLDGSSAACVVVTGRRQRFVLHTIPNRADRRIGVCINSADRGRVRTQIK